MDLTEHDKNGDRNLDPGRNYEPPTGGGSQGPAEEDPDDVVMPVVGASYESPSGGGSQGPAEEDPDDVVMPVTGSNSDSDA